MNGGFFAVIYGVYNIPFENSIRQKIETSCSVFEHTLQQKVGSSVEHVGQSSVENASHYDEMLAAEVDV